MTRGQLWILTSRQTTRAATRLRSAASTWCYLGLRLRERERIARVLTPMRRVVIGEELNRVAEELQQPFLDWMAAIGARQRNPRTWWSGRIASRHPLQTDFFLLVCYAQLVMRWARHEEPSGTTRVVVVDDPWLFLVLRQALASADRVCFFTNRAVETVVDVIRWLLKMPLANGYALCWALLSMIVARWSFRRSPEHLVEPKGQAILLYTWIVPQCFTVPGQLQDPHTGRLEELLKRHGQRVVRLTPLKIGLRNGLLRRLRPFAASCLVAPQHLHLWDILRVSLAWFTIDHLRELSRFQGAEYRPLFWRELLQEWGSLEVAGYRLWYLTMRRVARRYGDRVKLVLYPFENQPWEKLLCLAFREQAPTVRLVGYQHSRVSPRLLNYRLGRGELTFMPLPDWIVTNGPLSLELLQEGGFPIEHLANGGAFRYEHLFTARPRLQTSARSTQASRRILVAVPLSRLQGASLLRELAEVFPQPEASRLDGLSLEFVVKCHPELPLEQLLPGMSLPKGFTVSTQPLTELFETADLLLYTPPTTSRWEAAAAGLPVLRYRTDWLDTDESEGAAICSRDTVRSALLALLQSRTPAPAASTDVLQRVFSPVDEDVWVRLIQGA